MTEQMPINQAATEQRLVEELTGAPTPLEQHEEAELRPGDPQPTGEEDPQTQD